MNFCALLLIASIGATARVDDTFVVRQSVQTVTSWLVRHPEAIASSMQCQVVGRSGDKTHLVKQTIKGTFEFVMREHIAQAAGGTVVYGAALLQSIRGGMSRNDVWAKLSPVQAGGCRIELCATATVDRLGYFDMQLGMNQARKSFRATMESYFR